MPPVTLYVVDCFQDATGTTWGGHEATPAEVLESPIVKEVIGLADKFYKSVTFP